MALHGMAWQGVESSRRVSSLANLSHFGPLGKKERTTEGAAKAKVALARSLEGGGMSDRWVRSSRRVETIIALPRPSLPPRRFVGCSLARALAPRPPSPSFCS